MLRAATCLCVLQVLFALRDSEVAHLIPDQPTFIDTPTVPASSAIVTASEEVPQVQDLEVDLSKIDLAELEELPNCTNGELRLSAGVYKVTQDVDIQESCNVTAHGTTLLVTATLKFVETARLDGKLSVKAMNALQGPCLAFKSDAFVAASAELQFANCHNVARLFSRGAEAHGGAMNVRGSLMVMGTLIIRDCGTEDGNGGAIAVEQDFFHNGSISISNSSSALENGGSIYVHKNFHHTGGSISVEGSSAKWSGGAIYVDNFTQSGGSLAVMNSSAQDSGGAIFVSTSFNHSGGSISVKGTSAKYGGAIYVKDNFHHSGGNISVEGSSAEWKGGAIYVREDFTQSGGSIAVMNSSAHISGGGLYVAEDMAFTNAMATFSQCHARLEGGGINTFGNVSLTNASLSFELATTDGRGAALLADALEQVGGRMTVYNSSASGASGAVIDAKAWAIDGGSFRIEHCTSKSFLIAAKLASLRATSFDVANCSAAGMLVSSSEVLLRNSVFSKTSLPQIRAPVVDVSNCNITGSEAWISAEKAIVKDIDCDVPFAAYYDEGDGLGCKSCEPGTLFVKNSTTNTIGSTIQRCVPCPDGAKICNATAVEMMPGRMVELSNLSRSYRPKSTGLPRWRCIIEGVDPDVRRRL